ncbi:Ribosomal biogenesis, methyltransferase, EMG1/NEP [Parasponia andersonii]|uniref:Ribosomal biogenesis, methyltransferase, EMG1/NEP n=1 Tax=Parasponia andersonii TaxID=3476 RepID=A0A2P5AQ36_PARAD|nr:Ribosomal biogenesis, methyltransferase, EMG1/NEP [Parasponia andersonii]
MVRPYAVKGKKKRKKTEERYDKEEEEEEEENHDQELDTVQTKEEEEPDQEEKEPEEEKDGDSVELEGIPLAPSTQKPKDQPGVIFILEKASLEVAKVGKTYQLLNSDDHAHFLMKNNKNPGDYRPDIAHQALLMILDSPLNKAGRLRAVYVRTEKGVLIEVKPVVRLPRTFKRFSGIILQLLQKLSINAAGKREKLLRVIKNPVTQYLPVDSRKIGLSYSSDKLVKMHDYVGTFSNETNLVFVVGAMAHGKIEPDYVDDYIAVSGYPLSAAYCITMICQAMERKWNIL